MRGKEPFDRFLSASAAVFSNFALKRADVGVHSFVQGAYVSIESVYLIVYFFSYSAAVGCLALCAVSRVRKGIRSLSRYCWWVVASVAFLLLRNIAFFLKEFRGIDNAEASFAFYALYMLTMSVFLGTLSWVSLGYAFSGRASVVRRATFAATVIPLAFLPALACIERGIPDQLLRLRFINAVMYFSYYAVVAVIVTLAVRLPKIPDRFERLLCKTNVVAGSSYVIIALAQWFFVYRGQLYDINPFCIVNIVLFLMFSSSGFVIGREFLSQKDEPREAVAVGTNRFGLSGEVPSYPGCNQEEAYIILLISKGATNREVAEVLGTNVSRVKNLIYRIFARFGVKSRTELVCFFGESVPLTQKLDLLERSAVGIDPRALPDS